MSTEWHAMRASSLSDANDCMRRTLVRTTFNTEMRERFGVRPRPSPHIAAVVGTAMHKYAQTGERDWENFTKAAFSAPVRFDQTTPDRVTCRRQLNEMADRFDRTFMTWREGAHLIEADLETTFMVGEEEVRLTGHPDMVDQCGIVYDLKTGRRSDSPQHAAQMGAYAILLNRVEKIKVTGLRVVSLSRSDEDIITYDYDLKESVALAIGSMKNLVRARRALEDHYSVEADLLRELSEHAPSNPSSIICTPTYCESFSTGICPITRMGKEAAHG